MRSVLLVVALLAALGHGASAQYTKSAGHNAPLAAAPATVYDKDGRAHTEMVMRPVPADAFGNAQGNQHDLAIDGAFKGQTVAVIQLYTQDFDFSLPRAALAEKVTIAVDGCERGIVRLRVEKLDPAGRAYLQRIAVHGGAARASGPIAGGAAGSSHAGKHAHLTFRTHAPSRLREARVPV